MKLHLRRADEFTADYEDRIRWFREQGGPDLAIRFLFAVDKTLDSLARQPGVGRKRNFVHPKLQGLRSFLITRPFNNYLLFYRFDSTHLYAFRLVHGARDLPRRLLEQPRDE